MIGASTYLQLLDILGELAARCGWDGPMLDGGHLLFYGIEAARGRPLSEVTQEIGFRIGLAFVLMLMIFATGNDIWNLIHNMFS